MGGAKARMGEVRNPYKIFIGKLEGEETT